MKTSIKDSTLSSPHTDHDSQWKDHDHIPGSAVQQAQSLVDQLGNAEMAKEAVDMVAGDHKVEAELTEDETRAALAKALGFDSYGSLLAASQHVASNDGLTWYLTSLPDNSWAAWNDVQLHLDRHYASREEALLNVPHDAECSGSSMLG
jgi:hypothetical protein